MTDDLAAFLAARLDEVAAVASAATPGPWRSMGRNVHIYGDGEKWWRRAPAVAECDYTTDADPDDNAAHIALHDPDRALREVAAGRALLDAFDEIMQLDPDDGPERHVWRMATAEVVRMLIIDRARVWSGHPDFDESWGA